MKKIMIEMMVVLTFRLLWDPTEPCKVAMNSLQHLGLPLSPFLYVYDRLLLTTPEVAK
jgi:hypothetical protein